MASELKVNTLTGVSTAGSIAVTSEDNSTTINLQGGLTKAWWMFDQANTNPGTVRDSLAVSGIVDNSAGNATASFTNAFASSTRYSATSCMAYQNDTIANAFRGNGNIVRAAGSLQWMCVFVSSTGGAGSVEDDDENSWQLCGDLA